MKPEAQLLMRAADLIVERGWTQHKSVSSFGELCASEATYCANNWTALDHQDASEMWQRARNALRLHIGTAYIADWNDAPERTAEEVITALRATAREIS